MLGKALKYMRKKRGLNQKELAKILGIARTTVAGYEQEYREPTFTIIEEIAKICDFKIIFRHKDEEFQLKDLSRKDI